MFFTLKDCCTFNISTIRKLIRENSFNINAEIGPIAKGEFGTKRAPRYHTALTFASWKGDLNLVKCLIDEDANPGVFTSQGLSAIHCCCMQSGDNNLAVLKYFLEHPEHKMGIDLGNNRDGVTPLMYACSLGLYDVAEFLLQKNAEVNCQDREGKSALFHAAKRGHLNLVKLLVEHNAWVNLRDNNNGTVLHQLVDVFRSSSSAGTKLFKILTFLVDEKGLNISYQTRSGSTALHEACRRGLTEVVSFLLSKGANLETKKNGWETPLWTLVTGICPRPTLVALMFEKGANFEARNCIGLTLLQYAKQIAKNVQLTVALEDVQKMIRAQRMKALIARRKEILSFTTVEMSDKDVSWRGISLTSKLGQTGKNAVQNGMGSKSRNKIVDVKPSVECDDDNIQASNGRDALNKNVPAQRLSGNHDHISSEESDSGEDNAYTSSNKDNEEVEIKCKTTKDIPWYEVDYNKKEESCNLQLKDISLHYFHFDYATGKIVRNATVGNNSGKEFNRNSANDCKSQCDTDNNKSIDEGNNIDDAPTPLPNNRSNYDVDACFDRLLRKKRLLEQSNLQQTFADSVLDDVENEGQEQEETMENNPKPQKIKCVRRSAVSLSDSDSD